LGVYILGVAVGVYILGDAVGVYMLFSACGKGDETGGRVVRVAEVLC